MFRHCAKCLCGLYYLRNKQEGLLMILTPFYRRGNEGLRLAKCQRSTGCCPRTSHNASRWWSWTLSSGLSVWNAQFSSVTQSCLTLCDPIDCSTPGFLILHYLLELLKLMSIELVMPSNHLILCCLLLLLPSIFPSLRVFSNESVLRHQVAKVLELQLQHQSVQ